MRASAPEFFSCPKCHAILGRSGPPRVTRCRYCGCDLVEAAKPPTPKPLRMFDTIERSLERRAELEPLMKALMERYAAALGSGQRAQAMELYEAFQYVVLALAYDVEELEDLEGIATPLVQQAARQIGAEYSPPGERDEIMSWSRVEALATED
ncbi:MAG: hypothetical protein HY791_22775 [Deltaproteobacteria bacterium]|nr:hypothetical protein [Deltaproteobacteria bacterium]